MDILTRATYSHPIFCLYCTNWHFLYNMCFIEKLKYNQGIRTQAAAVFDIKSVYNFVFYNIVIIHTAYFILVAELNIIIITIVNIKPIKLNIMYNILLTNINTLQHCNDLLLYCVIIHIINEQ